MAFLRLKSNSKVVRSYYQELSNLAQLNLFSEGAVSPAFAALLRYCAKQFEWTLSEQQTMKRGKYTIRPDGLLLDSFGMVRGVWEAKDSADELAVEVKKKFAVGYPRENIIFQSPQRMILWQDGQQVLDLVLDSPRQLVMGLKVFFEYEPPALEAWEQAVEEFKEIVPELAQKLLGKIREEGKRNRRFIAAFAEFTTLCQQALNPNISTQALEEMLIQHLLTERIFRRVFEHSDFTNRNVIAHEIEKVIQALTSQAFSRKEFLKDLNHLYDAIESTAATIDEYAEKQSFLNTVYEKFFQGFSVKVADTHGIVYTPQPIVDFMVRSVDEILKREFGRVEGLGAKGVHVLDPFVGTGNFMLRVMRQMSRRQLAHKYKTELHCNEVMLLPYYIASMNLEHEYYDITGHYEPFGGICLVDTFQLVEEAAQQLSFGLFTAENSERVQRQKEAPIFVVIGNPPYNAGQVNENDNNKNRTYPVLDGRVRETYAKDSQASNVQNLFDAYVKAFRWASDRLGDEGIVAFVTNNGFIEQLSFDGMRRHLAQDFDTIYLLDLGGNVRQNTKLSGTTHNVFGIQVGVSIVFLVKHKEKTQELQLYYAATDELWSKEQKYRYLEQHRDYTSIDWQVLTPNKKQTWLTEGLHSEFDMFLPMGTKAAKRAKEASPEAIFQLYSLGANTNRDAWAYNHSPIILEKNIRRLISAYNIEVDRWNNRAEQKAKVDHFILKDDTQIKWSSSLKSYLRQSRKAEFSTEKIREVLYRPFTSQYLFFDEHLTHRQGQLPRIFPTPESQAENRVICVGGYGRKPFSIFISKLIPDINFYADPQQCFPFYTYNEDGSNRQENITDWALTQFRHHYKDASLSKWDIFYYVYALLHHPDYRDTYAQNLKRALPHIPYAPDFDAFAQAGERLADIHLHYDTQDEYNLEEIENADVPMSYRVEKMKLAKDKKSLRVNDFLTLTNIPPATYEYKLGNRSALEWIIDQYRLKTDKRSGISNDPNRDHDPEYIIRLIGQVITVSLETVQIVQALPEIA